jgi:hypothetical protein
MPYWCSLLLLLTVLLLQENDDESETNRTYALLAAFWAFYQQLEQRDRQV